MIKTQYITDNKGKKLAVILPIKEYDKIIADLEELEDIKLYDQTKESVEEYLDANEAFKEIEEQRNASQV